MKPAITGVIVAAGFSKRMGSFKPLNDFEGETYIETITRKILPFCGKTIIVTGFKSEKIEAIIKKRFNDDPVKLVFNPDFEKGMFTSLQKGVSIAGESEWILYHFVDQPFFTLDFYKEFLSNADESFDWIQPSYNGREGHPILFNSKVTRLILAGSQDSNLRAIKENPSINKSKWECSYPEIRMDFDTEENIRNYYNLKK